MENLVDVDDEVSEPQPPPSRLRLRILVCVTVVLGLGGLACLRWAWELSVEQCKRDPLKDDPVIVATGGGFALGMVAVICVLVFDIMNRINAPHRKV